MPVSRGANVPYVVCSCQRVCRGGARVLQTRYDAVWIPSGQPCSGGASLRSRHPASLGGAVELEDRAQLFQFESVSLCSGYLSIDIELNVRLQSFHQLLVRRSQPLRRSLDKHVTSRLNALKGVMPDWIFDIFCVIAAEGRASLMRQARGRRAGGGCGASGTSHMPPKTRHLQRRRV